MVLWSRNLYSWDQPIEKRREQINVIVRNSLRGMGSTNYVTRERFFAGKHGDCATAHILHDGVLGETSSKWLQSDLNQLRHHVGHVNGI